MRNGPSVTICSTLLRETMRSSQAGPVFESEADAARQSDRNLVVFHAESQFIAGMWEDKEAVWRSMRKAQGHSLSVPCHYCARIWSSMAHLQQLGSHSSAHLPAGLLWRCPNDFDGNTALEIFEHHRKKGVAPGSGYHLTHQLPILLWSIAVST